MKRILLTGFEPFNNHSVNPSEKLAQALSIELQLEHLILAVSYQRSLEKLEEHLRRQNYDFVLMLGLASEREEVCLERVGLNIKDSKIPDADGAHPRGEKISLDGESAFFNEWPLSQWIENTEMKVSNHAGAYVCNFIYYKMLSGVYGKKSLFVHVPVFRNSKHEDEIKKDLKKLISTINEALSAL